MRIIGLRASDVLRLEAVAITPTGNVVEITGPNDAGKTSLIDCIWIALGGGDAMPAKPIREGAKEGIIEIDLGDNGETRLHVRKKITKREDGSLSPSLVVETPEGMRAKSPQKTLDEMWSALAADPLDFMRSTAADQATVIQKLVPGTDFAALTKANEDDFAERTVVNRRAKEQRARAAAWTAPADAPPERVDEAQLVDELTRAGEHNADVERRKASAARLNQDRDAAKRAVAAEEERLVDLQRQVSECEQRIEAARAREVVLIRQIDDLPRLPEPIDVTGIRSSIDAARSTNALFDSIARQKAAAEDAGRLADAADAESKALTAKIEGRKRQMADAIAAAKLPVEGLSIADGIVMLNDIPLSQASAAMQLRVSVAIAAALNPKLRVIRIKDGSLLDKNSWAALVELAEAMKVQIFCETVESGRAGAIVIEDGRVVTQSSGAAA